MGGCGKTPTITDSSPVQRQTNGAPTTQQADESDKRTRVTTKDRSRVGIVVDVDETISVTDYRGLIFGFREDRSTSLENARDVLTRLSEDFEIIYLTARPQRLFTATRTWLLKQGFPSGPVLTSYRAVDLLWPGPFKMRALAVLRTNSPHLLIGIGDRLLDAQAYTGNFMKALIVNAQRGKRFSDDALLFDNWQQLGEFFEKHHDTLSDESKLKAKFGVGGGSLHPEDVPSAPKMEDAGVLWPVKYLLAGPALLGDWVKNMWRRVEQTRAQTLLGQGLSLEKAIEIASEKLRTDGLLKVQVRSNGGVAGYEVYFLRDGHSYKTWLNAKTSEMTKAHRTFLPMLAEIKAHRTAQFDLAAAIKRAREEIDGEAYEAELEIDDGHAAYEVAMMSLGRFIEIEMNAETGAIVEVEDETTIR